MPVRRKRGGGRGFKFLRVLSIDDCRELGDCVPVLHWTRGMEDNPNYTPRLRMYRPLPPNVSSRSRNRQEKAIAEGQVVSLDVWYDWADRIGLENVEDVIGNCHQIWKKKGRLSNAEGIRRQGWRRPSGN